MAILEMKVPSPGESINEVQISRWLVKDGDVVEKDDALCEIDSDKATLTLNAESGGMIKIVVNENETIAVGTVVCTIDTEKSGNVKEKTVEKTEFAKVSSANSTVQSNYAKGIPSVAAGKIIKENSIKPEEITPTGKGGRITKADVLEKLNAGPSQKISALPATGKQNGQRPERREKMTMLRKRLAERLVRVKQETAMLTTFNEVDMSAIIRLRIKHKEAFMKKHGTQLGFMSFFTKAVCESLRNFPMVNARIDGDDLVFHDFCDIGIAVSAPKGLMVPVIRNAESMSLAEIEKQVADLAGKAREGKISIDEMTGGTFTITNGGVFGSMLSTPIINPPQSAILGMHNIVERPVALNGKVEIRPVMYVALSYDHRIIDGRESVSFLLNIKKLLENPVSLLFGGADPEKTLLGL